MFGSTGVIVSVVVNLVMLAPFFAQPARAADFFQVGPVQYFADVKRTLKENFQQDKNKFDWRQHRGKKTTCDPTPA